MYKSLYLNSSLEKFTFFKKNQKSIYIHGPPGGGKTFLVQLFFYTIKKNNLSDKVLRIHFQEFMNSIHEKINYFRLQNKKNPLREVANKIAGKYRLICFDELEIIDIADAMLVSKVFETLLKKKVSFVITSNYRPKDLYKDGLQRSQFEPFIDLIEKKMNLLEIKNKSDLRLSHKSKKTKNFLYPINIKTKIEFDKAFSKLGSYKNITNKKIISLGRELVFNKCHEKILYTDFNYICSYKFSPNDYIKISNSFEWIFIDNIPILGRTKLNEIRRFIVLIDILYEKKNKVFMRAEKNINELFQIEKSKQPYSRTISRIVEMSLSTWQN